MKRVLITLYRDRCHSLYRQFLSVPPQGYTYVTLDDVTSEDIFQPAKSMFGEVINKIKRNRKIIRLAKNNNIDLIYCCSGILLFRSPLPWIVDIEHVTDFIAHHFGIWKFAKWLLPFLLMQRNLKAIIPWTEAGARSVFENIWYNQSIRNKMHPIPLCVQGECSWPNEKKDDNPGKSLTLLFSTSINDNTENVFYSKGGRHLVAVYEHLRDRVPLRLILRSRIPKAFSFLRERSDVVIYEESLDKDAYEELFHQADVFFFPGYQSPGLVFLDAIMHGLPIVTTDVFSNREMAIPEYNGYLVPFPKESNVYYWHKKYGIKMVPTGNYAYAETVNNEMVSRFCSCLQELYGNFRKLRTFGKNSRKLFREKYTLQNRNKLLKEIFDKAQNL
jgi:glycosyltransferase involved in cell wall biosynthesis